MGKLLLAAACLFLIPTVSHAQEPVPDPIAAKITAAKDAFYAERDKAEEVLLAALARKEAAAKQTGDIKTIETVRAETEAFRKEGTLPKSVPLTTYNTSMKTARTKLENVYLATIKTYTQADKIEEAKELQAELIKLQQAIPNDPAPGPAANKNPTPGNFKGQSLRVLTFNIRHAAGENGLQRVADVIKSVDADLVALQFVDRNVGRSGKVDQAAELAKLTKLDFSEFGNNLKFGGGEFGNAIISRWPIKSFKHHLLPSPGGGEPRGLSAAVIELPNKTELHFWCLGLDRNDKNQRASLDYVTKLAAALPNQPIVLGGQLEEKPDHKIILELSKYWGRTTPFQPLKGQIDYLMYRPANRFQVLKPEALASDKFEFMPVWGELRVK